MLIGINGVSKSGKDTLADMLVPFKSQKVALADEMKRIVRSIYPAMTVEHMWGPSEKRNEKIPAYPRGPHVYPPSGTDEEPTCVCCGTKYTDDREQCYLTPRYALQLLGTEWGRHCYLDTWVDIILKNYLMLMNGGYLYSPPLGLLAATIRREGRYAIVAVPDCRYRNELEAIRRVGGKLWRIKRVGGGLKGGMGKHTSETEQLQIPDEYFDQVFDNNSTLEGLQMHLEYIMKGN